MPSFGLSCLKREWTLGCKSKPSSLTSLERASFGTMSSLLPSNREALILSKPLRVPERQLSKMHGSPLKSKPQGSPTWMTIFQVMSKIPSMLCQIRSRIKCCQSQTNKCMISSRSSSGKSTSLYKSFSGTRNAWIVELKEMLDCWMIIVTWSLFWFIPSQLLTFILVLRYILVLEALFLANASLSSLGAISSYGH